MRWTPVRWRRGYGLDRLVRLRLYALVRRVLSGRCAIAMREDRQRAIASRGARVLVGRGPDSGVVAADGSAPGATSIVAWRAGSSWPQVTGLGSAGSAPRFLITSSTACRFGVTGASA